MQTLVKEQFDLFSKDIWFNQTKTIVVTESTSIDDLLLQSVALIRDVTSSSTGELVYYN